MRIYIRQALVGDSYGSMFMRNTLFIELMEVISFWELDSLALMWVVRTGL